MELSINPNPKEKSYLNNSGTWVIIRKQPLWILLLSLSIPLAFFVFFIVFAIKTADETPWIIIILMSLLALLFMYLALRSKRDVFIELDKKLISSKTIGLFKKLEWVEPTRDFLGLRKSEFSMNEGKDGTLFFYYQLKLVHHLKSRQLILFEKRSQLPREILTGELDKTAEHFSKILDLPILSDN